MKKENDWDKHIPLFRKTFRKMKISTLLLTFAICSISATSYSQSYKVSIDKQASSILEILKEIEQASEFTFFYNDNQINVNKKVDLSMQDATIEEVLNELLGDTNYTYQIVDRQVIIKTKALAEKLMIQQDTKISGVVKDNFGIPIIGANVSIKGTKIGTITDLDGKFMLSIPTNSTLTISYIGYKDKMVLVGDKTELSIVLLEDTQALDEVVVVGYGTQKKVNLTGAVVTLSSERIDSRPIASVSEGLQGTMPGVTVTRDNGSLGSNSTIQIRGFSSLNSGGALVIVDGVPGSMNDISPNDIETISILKDAASSSIYGARAAEGVILITTKKGTESEKMKIQYSSNYSFQNPTRLPEPNGSYDGAVYANLAFTNAGSAPLYPQWQLDAFKDPSTTAVAYDNQSEYYYTADFNWWDYFMDNSFQQTQNLSLSGGSKINKYMVSASWLDQNGYFSEHGPDNFDRFTVRVNLNNQLIPEKLILDTNFSLMNSDKDQPGVDMASNIMASMRQAGNGLPMYNPDGTYARHRMQSNTMQLMKESGFDKTKKNRFEGRAALSWNAMEGLSFKALGGYNVEWTKRSYWQRAYYKYRPSGPSNLGNLNQPNCMTETNTYYNYYIGQLQANYDKTFGKHTLGLLAGTSVEESIKSETGTSRNNILGNEVPSLNLGETASAKNSYKISDDWGLVSAFARVNYNYNERYLVEANVRMDGSSRFSTDNKWGVFPSVSLAWRITEEAFMENQTVFSNLKLRGSYGQLGNQNGLGLYDHVPVYTVDTDVVLFPGGDSQQIYTPSLPSTDRAWETITSYNIGVDMSFLDNRLDLVAEVFEKKNEDMLIDIEIPSTIGIKVPTGNYGELKTKGWEVNVSWHDEIETIGLKYNVGFNFYDQTDELVDMARDFAKPTIGKQNLQGYPINSFFLYEADGYFETQEEVDSWAFQNINTAPGDIRYKDQNGDGKITDDDLIHAGTTTPRFSYGFNLGAEWKGFDISAFFQGVGKRSTYLGTADVHPYANSWDNYSFTDLMDYWTPENLDARFPRPHQGGHNYIQSTHWLQNSSYLRLKNLQIGYNLPKSLLSKGKIEALRFYLSGENLFEFTDMIMYDPEALTAAYPLNRSYSVGVSLTF
jgi:TonB-linked SusC/RagA family outer membrane protein